MKIDTFWLKLKFIGDSVPL